jgi:hypothetical protein
MYVMLLFLLKANSMSKLYLKRTFGYWLSCLFEIAFVATRPFRKLAHLPLSCHSSSTRKSSSGKKRSFILAASQRVSQAATGIRIGNRDWKAPFSGKPQHPRPPASMIVMNGGAVGSYFDPARPEPGS